MRYSLSRLDAARRAYLNYDMQVSEDNSVYYADYLKGRILYEMEDYDKAMPFFKKCFEQYKEEAFIYYYLGVCYLYAWEPEYNTAYRYLQKAKEKGFTLSEDINEFIESWKGRDIEPLDAQKIESLI